MIGLNCNAALEEIGLPLTKAQGSRLRPTMSEDTFKSILRLSDDIYEFCKLSTGVFCRDKVYITDAQKIIYFAILAGVLEETEGFPIFVSTKKSIDTDPIAVWERLGSPRTTGMELGVIAGILRTDKDTAGLVLQEVLMSAPSYALVRKLYAPLLERLQEISTPMDSMALRYFGIEDFIRLLDYYRLYLSACSQEERRNLQSQLESGRKRYVSECGVQFPSFKLGVENSCGIQGFVKSLLLG